MSFYRKSEIPPHLLGYFVPAEIGLEPTPEAYVAKMVEVFEEVRRVLRPDGCMFLNVGDSYASSGTSGTQGGLDEFARRERGQSDNGPKTGHRVHGRAPTPAGIKPKDLLGIPWALAFALRAAGWWLRSEIIWHKPNPMPESVTDRPTKAHEQIFLLSKSGSYFYDAEAVREPSAPGTVERFGNGHAQRKTGKAYHVERHEALAAELLAGRNARTVWTIPTKPYSEAHFATFPPAIPETCLKAGTSAKGCCAACGAPWERVVEAERVATREPQKSKLPGYMTGERLDSYGRDRTNDAEVGRRDPMRHVTTTTTTGWRPGCTCSAPTVPCLILDPFAGAATTILVAKYLGLRAIGFELNSDYAEMGRRRVERGILEDQPKQPASSAGQKSLFEVTK